MKGSDQPDASLITAKCAGNCSDRPDQSCEPKRCSARDAERCAGQQAHENSSTQPYRGCAGGSVRKLIGNEFAQGAESKNADRPDRTHECQVRTGKIDPTQIGRPSHNGGSRHRSQASHNANTKCQQQYESNIQKRSSVARRLYRFSVLRSNDRCDPADDWSRLNPRQSSCAPPLACCSDLLEFSVTTLGACLGSLLHVHRSNAHRFNVR
jgi:hypothetical protein